MREREGVLSLRIHLSVHLVAGKVDLPVIWTYQSRLQWLIRYLMVAFSLRFQDGNVS